MKGKFKMLNIYRVILFGALMLAILPAPAMADDAVAGEFETVADVLAMEAAGELTKRFQFGTALVVKSGHLAFAGEHRQRVSQVRRVPGGRPANVQGIRCHRRGDQPGAWVAVG